MIEFADAPLPFESVMIMHLFLVSAAAPFHGCRSFAPVASSAASEVVNVFGQGGDYNVKFHTPDFKIEY